MSDYSSTSHQPWIKVASVSPVNIIESASRETAFDPFNYEFDAGTMVEPFTYFNNGPTGSRQKVNAFLSPSSAQYSFLSSHSRSVLSSPDGSPQSYASPIMQESNRSQTNTPQQVSQSPSSYPKTICRHCKSHNMPECLYTSHSMYDESGAVFCPVLKKCHCATCIRATNPNTMRDDESDDDDNHIRLPPLFHQWNRVHGPAQRGNVCRSNNNNC